MARDEIVVGLLRSLEFANGGGDVGAGTSVTPGDRLFVMSDLWHGVCGAGCREGRPGAECISPYAELERLLRRGGPMERVCPSQRWHVLMRYVDCERRPLRVRVRYGKYVLPAYQAVVGDLVVPRVRATRKGDWEDRIVESWDPRVDLGKVRKGVAFLADRRVFRVPLQLPAELVVAA